MVVSYLENCDLTPVYSFVVFCFYIFMYMVENYSPTLKEEL